VTLMNSPSFHLVVEQSDGVTVRGLTISAPAHSPNTDAIDPTDTRNMLIEGNTLDVGDDIVAIKANRVDPAHPDFSVENIVIRNNVGRAGRGICIGSGTLGGVRHVVVEHNRIAGAMYGIRIKTLRDKGGRVADVVFRDTVLTDVATPFVFSDYYTSKGFDEDAVAAKLRAGGFTLNDQIYPAENEPPQPFVAHRTPDMDGVVVDGLVATGADRVGLIVGLPEKPIRGLVFRNSRVTARAGLRVRHAQVSLKGLSTKVASGPALIREAGAALD
jgi:polygalacturonase